MVSFTSCPMDFKVAVTKSTTIGLHPPQELEAFVFFTTSDKVQQVPFVMELQIVPLLTASQEQICAVSGKSSTEPKALLLSPPLDPKIKSSGFSGSFIALM